MIADRNGTYVCLNTPLLGHGDTGPVGSILTTEQTELSGASHEKLMFSLEVRRVNKSICCVLHGRLPYSCAASNNVTPVSCIDL